MMWLVRLALRQPYTIVVMCLLIFTLGVLTIITTPKDIFPDINIPVVSVILQFNGITPDDMEKRIVTVSERATTTTVNDVEHIESQSLYGVGVVKIFFHPEAKIEQCVAQVTAIMQTIVRAWPPGMTPPAIIQYRASSVPILQMGVSSDTLTEQQVYDQTINFIRVYLYRTEGAQLPAPYGGKQRAIMVDMNPETMLAQGVTATDLSQALTNQNLILPAGTAKMGPNEYDIQLNASTQTADALNDLPLKVGSNGAEVYLRDVAHVRDGFQVQTNIVNQDGHRAALLPIIKAGGASTLDVVAHIKAMVPAMLLTLPKALKVKLLFDQSLFVEASIFSVVREGVIAAALTGLMILLFLGSWRSTLVVTTSIPLAILSSIIILGAMGVTLNVMTLGGLALAVGILVDDATVEVENIHRNHAMGKPLRQAILDGAAQIATPTFVSTLSICIVFVSVQFLTGAAKFMFTPMALAVVFAMLASYMLSRTLVPTMVNALLAHEVHGGSSPVSKAIWNAHYTFDHAFERMRARYEGMLGWALDHPKPVFAGFGVFLALSACLLPLVGEDFFPSVDAGQFRLHVRCASGMRLEETEHQLHQVELALRDLIPADEIKTIIDNIGLPSGFNMAFTDTATVGPNEGEILVALTEDHHPTPDYLRKLRRELPKRFPQMSFFFQPADMVNQILNFGLPAPIDIQVQGRDHGNVAIARRIEAELKQVPGAVDAHLHQIIDAPAFHVEVDRERAALLGLTQQNVASNILLALSGSGQVAPNFWLSPQNSISYNVTLQTPQRDINSLSTLLGQPMTDIGSNVSTEQLSNLATVTRTTLPAVVSHYNVQPVLDVYANVQGRDLGGVSADAQKILERIVNPDHPRSLDWSVPQNGPGLPRTSVLVMRGQTLSMTESFTRLGFGLLFAILLVYMLMVVNFQSWIDPLVIICALPGALSGIVWMLFLTQTTFSVPSLMGAIMCIGVAVANSILVVTFANDCRHEGDDARTAALRAGDTRLRPVLMTAAAMIIGMLPMALSIGEGAEQNAPLGRAVIGGLLVATVTTLFIVPLVYRSWRVQAPKPIEAE